MTSWGTRPGGRLVVLMGALLVAGCAPSDAYLGPGRIMLEWGSQVVTAQVDAVHWESDGEDFVLEVRWTDPVLGPVAADLGQRGGAVGREIRVGERWCRVTQGGLVKAATRELYPRVFAGSCVTTVRETDQTMTFRLAFAR